MFVSIQVSTGHYDRLRVVFEAHLQSWNSSGAQSHLSNCSECSTYAIKHFLSFCSFVLACCQGFWSVFNNIPDVGKLKNGYTYHLMKNDRRPVWYVLAQIFLCKCRKKFLLLEYGCVVSLNVCIMLIFREDEQNASGGTWKFKCSKFDSVSLLLCSFR